MKKIDGTPKTIRELFTGVKYTIHYYQREYQWQTKQIEELLDDLSEEFFEFYSPDDERGKVLEYGHYFMGSIVLTADDNAIIDGQQRLTSLTLLLVYLYHSLEDEEERAEVLQLIYSKKAGTKTFNIHVPEMPERYNVMNALLQNEYMDVSKHAETIRNIYNRYHEMKAMMNDLIRTEALPIFKDWLIDNVDFIRIVAQTEQDAHKIFVSMNDRGLSLTPISISNIELNMLGQGTTFLELSRESLSTFKIPLPDIGEQQLIAEYLETQIEKIDKVVSNKKAVVERLNELRQIEINNAVTKGLVQTVKVKPSELEWLGEIPKHWKENRLKYVSNINQNVITEKTNPDYEIKYIDIGNVTSNGEFLELQDMIFSEAPSRARRKLQRNSILLSTVRTYLRAIAFVPNPQENLIASTGFAVIDGYEKLFNPKYLFYQMTSHILVERIIANSDGVSYPAISSTKLGDLKILIPPKEEQNEIVNYLDKKIGALNTLIKNTAQRIKVEIAGCF